MKGIYPYCGEQHLHRYLAEFDFRYSNCAKLGITDAVRADEALSRLGWTSPNGGCGRRLGYQPRP